MAGDPSGGRTPTEDRAPESAPTTPRGAIFSTGSAVHGARRSGVIAEGRRSAPRGAETDDGGTCEAFSGLDARGEPYPGHDRRHDPGTNRVTWPGAGGGEVYQTRLVVPWPPQRAVEGVRETAGVGDGSCSSSRTLSSGPSPAARRRRPPSATYLAAGEVEHARRASELAHRRRGHAAASLQDDEPPRRMLSAATGPGWATED